MTPEELFEEHYKFAYWYLARKFPEFARDDDMKQEALIGLWRACTIYDSNVGSFTALATKCIVNQVLMQFRKQSKLVVFSMEEEIPDRDGLTASGRLCDPCWENSFLNSEFMQDVSQLSDREQFILKSRLGGMSQKDIANKVGLSQGMVSRLIRSSMRKMGYIK